MKKLAIFLVIILLAAGASSCAKRDTVTGTWKASSVITADGREISVLELAADLGGPGAEEPAVVYRFSGGVVELFLNGETLSGSYKISGEKVYLTVDGIETSLTYDAENDTLTTEGTGIKTVFRREEE